MNLYEILSQLNAEQSQQNITIPDNWLQGRTCFGGLSSAIAYQAAKLSGGDNMPALKSAQIAFAGPLSGEVTVETSILRRGRNTAFIRSEIKSNDETGLSCSFIFMNDRESHIDHCDLTPPNFPTIPTGEEIRSGPPEFFTCNMEYKGPRLELGQDSPRLSKWMRLKHRDNVDPIAELLCMGDSIPPSAMGLMKEKGMVSSMNWQVNLLTNTPTTNDGWWFVDSQTHHCANGASSQYMSMWNSDGQPVITGMQSVAVFS